MEITRKAKEITKNNTNVSYFLLLYEPEVLRQRAERIFVIPRIIEMKRKRK
jgi:hypothetical protein